MAYSLPELVLVGAAQNLVLETSPADVKIDPICTGDGFEDRDPLFDVYNDEATW